jgi:hypothetical protein
MSSLFYGGEKGRLMGDGGSLIALNKFPYERIVVSLVNFAGSYFKCGELRISSSCPSSEEGNRAFLYRFFPWK